MKPSERMFLISKEIGIKEFPAWQDTFIVMKYLDEEWEKQQKVKSDAIREAAKRAAGLQ